jgi:hypothetical protein
MRNRVGVEIPPETLPFVSPDECGRAISSADAMHQSLHLECSVR